MKTKRWKKVVAIMLSVILIMQSNLSVIADAIVEQATEYAAETTEATQEETTTAVVEDVTTATEAATTATEVATTATEVATTATEAVTTATEAATTATEATTTAVEKETTQAPKRTKLAKTASKNLRAMNAPKAGSTKHEMAAMINHVYIKVKVNNTWYYIGEKPAGASESILPAGTTVAKNADVEVKISYDPSGRQFNAGDTIEYQLPEGIKPVSTQTGKVMDGPDRAGSYTIDTNGKIVVTIDNADYLEKTKGYLKNGNISFDGKFQSGSWGTGGDREIIFGAQKIEIPFTPDAVVTKAVLNIEKTKGNTYSVEYDKRGDAYIQYTITVSAPSDNTQDMTNVTVKDEFISGLEYVEVVSAIVPANRGEFSKDTMQWTGIGTLKPGESCSMTLRVKVKSEMFAEGGAGNRQIVNRAKVYSDGEYKNQDDSTLDTNTGLNIEKSNDGYVYDKEKGISTVTYKVKVSAPKNNTWPITNVTVTDQFGDNKSYVIEYTTVNAPSGTQITNTDNTNKKLDWNIGMMNPGDVKELTYTVQVDDNIFLDGNDNVSDGNINRTLNNTAYLKINGKNYSHDDSSVNFRKVWIWKNGTKEGNRIKFDIHANESTGGGPVLNGPVGFKDELYGDWEYDGNVTIRWYAQGPDNKGKMIKSYTFNPDNFPYAGKNEKANDAWSITSGDTTFPTGYYYELEYYAKYTGTGVGTPSISNKAGIGIGVGGTTYNHYYEWKGTANAYNSMTKAFKARNGNIATWQSKITTSIPAGAVYTDVRDGNYEWIFTDEQIKKIKVGGAGAGKNVTITRNGVSGFKIEFKEAITASSTNPITIDYSCTLRTDNVSPGATVTYKNKGELKVGNLSDTSTAKCTYTQEQKIVKAAGNYNENTGILKWSIKANVTGSLSGEAVITDELPEGLEFVKAAITNRGSEADAATLSASADGQTVTMNLSGLNQTFDKNAFVIITLTTRVVDRSFLTGNGSKKFVNEAVLTYQGESTSSRAETTIKNTSLTKEGVYNSNTAPDIVYTVVINPKSLDMLKNGDKIKVIDTMGVGMMLKTSTLTIKDEGGQIIDNNTVGLYITTNDKGETVFSMELPDDETITITYSAYVMGEIGKIVTVSNTVRYEGEATPEIEEKNKITISTSKATIEGAPAFYLKKVDGNDVTKPLKGAEYALYKVNTDGTLDEASRKVVASNDSGYVYFTDLNADAVYAFKEIVAPNGYYIDEVNAAFTYVAFSQSAITEAMKNLGVKVIQKGTTFERTNNKGEITVNKTFGHPNVKDGTYYVGLFKGNELLGVKGITVTNGVGSSVKFTGLDFGTYAVYETDKDGKRLSTDTNKIITVDGVEYEVSGEKTEVKVSSNDPKESVTIKNTRLLNVALKGTKALKNAEHASTQTFKFDLYHADVNGKAYGNPIATDEVTVTSTAKEHFTLGIIPNFKASDATKTFKYVLKESVPNGATATNAVDGITYDFKEYLIEVTVGHSDDTGVTATVKIDGEVIEKTDGYYAVPEHEMDEVTASFVNCYDAATSIKFEGTKTVTGATYNLPADKFKFTISGPNLKDAEGNVVDSLEIGHKADGSINYPEIGYTLADLEGKESKEFTYTITEVNGSKEVNGIVHSATTHTVVVVVTNTGKTLEAQAKTGYSVENLDFINEFNCEIEVNKAFGHPAGTENGSFYVALYKDGVLVQNQIREIKVTNGESSPVKFSGLDFGTYYVYETDANGVKLERDKDGAVTVNGTKYEVSGEGAVVITSENTKGEITITNTKALDIAFRGTKFFENVLHSARKTFTFDLYENEALAPIDTATINVENGKTAFVIGDELTYTAEDKGKTFGYTLKERVSDGLVNDGITFDSKEYVILVTVDYSVETGVTTTVTIDGKAVELTNNYYVIPEHAVEGVETTASFVNKYEADTSITFEGTKKLIGANYKLTKDMFSFKITGYELPGDGVIVGHEANGKINFPTFKYDLDDMGTEKTKEFTYTVEEVGKGEAIEGIQYSNASYEVVVVVTSTGTTMTAAAKEGFSTENLNFTNTYSAKATETVTVNKTYTDAALAADTFKFTITETTPSVENPYTETKSLVSVTAGDGVDTGSVTFTLPTYTQKDDGKTFTYTVSEVKGNNIGVTYSEEVYTVTVKVTDNKDGTLTLDKTIVDSKEKASDVVFTNDFNGSVVLTKWNDDKTEALEGAVFALYSQAGETPDVEKDQLIQTYTTGKNGTLTVTELDEGKYFFVETKAPAGYDIEDANPIPFVIKQGTQTEVNPTVEAINNKRFGTIKLQKNTSGDDATALEGAIFALYKVTGEDVNIESDTKIGEYTTDGKGQIVVQNLGWGTYYFVETVPAPGYVLDATPTETIVINESYVDEYDNVNAEGVTVTKTNESVKFEFAKVDAETKEPVAGATLQVVEKETGEVVVEAWESEAETYKVEATLVVGKTYILQETEVPAGYEFANSVEFTVDNTSELVTITMEDEQTVLSISKLDATGQEAVAGATFEIYEKAVYGTEDATPVDTWTTTDGDYIITGLLNVNTPYIMVETDAPVGYGYVEPIEFQITSAIDNDGKATTKVEILDSKAGEAEVDGIDGIDVFDRAVELYLNKVEAFAETEEPSEGEEAKKPEIVFVKGAELTIFDAEGKEVVAWTSDGENAFNFGPYLKADKTYTLKETAAPDGYAYIADINFKVNKDGSIEIIDKKLEVVTDEEGAVTYLVEDHFTKAVIKKVDSEGKQLKGAELVIKDAETGKEVMKFTSGEEAEEITGKLVAGKKYYLVEEKAPDGYLIAADVEFTVPEGEELVEVVMVDPKDEGEEKLGKISVQKNIALRTLEADFDLYTEDATYYVGLFTDPEGKHPYRADAIQPIRIIKGSTSDIVTYDKLPTGTYYILETTKDGKPIPMGEAQNDGKNVFTCEVVGEGQDNKLEIDVEQKAIEGKITLLNAYVELPDGYAYEGKINVTKNVLKNGVAYATDEVFYAGVFASETAETPVTVLTLENNGTATAVVPLGGTNGDQPITYYVYETDANGKKIDKEAFAYLVSGEGTVALSKEAPEGALTITNNLLTEVEVNILKVDTENVALAGAGFQVLAADGTVVAEWTSTEEAKSVILAPGTYTLTETEAPEGYVAGEDITITIAKDGTITIEGDGATLADNTISYENEEEVEETEETEEETSESSKTGDRTNMEIYMLLMAAAVITALAVARRKREEDL